MMRRSWVAINFLRSSAALMIALLSLTGHAIAEPLREATLENVAGAPRLRIAKKKVRLAGSSDNPMPSGLEKKAGRIASANPRVYAFVSRSGTYNVTLIGRDGEQLGSFQSDTGQVVIPSAADIVWTVDRGGQEPPIDGKDRRPVTGLTLRDFKGQVLKRISFSDLSLTVGHAGIVHANDDGSVFVAGTLNGEAVVVALSSAGEVIQRTKIKGSGPLRFYDAGKFIAEDFSTKGEFGTQLLDAAGTVIMRQEAPRPARPQFVGVSSDGRAVPMVVTSEVRPAKPVVRVLEYGTGKTMRELAVSIPPSAVALEKANGPLVLRVERLGDHGSRWPSFQVYDSDGALAADMDCRERDFAAMNVRERTVRLRCSNEERQLELDGQP